MAGQDYSRYQRGVIQRHYEHADTIALQRLSEIVSDLYLAQGSQATRLWNSARTALAKLAPADDPHVMKVLSVRSVTGLAKLVTELSAGAMAKAAASSEKLSPADPVVGDEPMSPPVERVSAVLQPVAAPSPTASPTPDDLRHAMKAFRKRLKLTRLDEESKLGRTGNPMSGGRKSEIVAIIPPREYPQPVWDELVRQGKLRRSGAFYELVEGV
jgi:hypothetical protein